MRVLITGSDGFIGKNLVIALKLHPDVEILEYDLNKTSSDLDNALGKADVIYHLAGVNRPEREEDFFLVNSGLTGEICLKLVELKRNPKIVYSSSIQVERSNAYGRSKLAGEQALQNYHTRTGSDVAVFRLKNVFGKWCRPNYNSVVATFCYNISRGLPISVSDSGNEVSLVYIDDVISCFIEELHQLQRPGVRHLEVKPDYNIKLGELVRILTEFKDSRRSLYLPMMNDPLITKLYATYLSYLPEDEFSYNLTARYDDRGSLAEFIKSPSIGQIFISRTNPGITRGNHFHHTKVEKFLVVEGMGVIRFRSIIGNKILEYPVDGRDFRVVDIPPGYTHSIENIGDNEMVVLFWAGEIFDPQDSDTFALKVKV